MSSFEIPVLDAFRRLRPDQPVAVLWVTPPQDWADKLHALSAIAVHVERGALSRELLASAVAEGVDLRVFTVNDPDEMAAFRIAGLAGVITDDPAAFLADPGWASWAEG